jgi:hypothetical protein
MLPEKWKYFLNKKKALPLLLLLLGKNQIFVKKKWDKLFYHFFLLRFFVDRFFIIRSQWFMNFSLLFPEFFTTKFSCKNGPFFLENCWMLGVVLNHLFFQLTFSRYFLWKKIAIKNRIRFLSVRDHNFILC